MWVITPALQMRKRRIKDLSNLPKVIYLFGDCEKIMPPPQMSHVLIPRIYEYGLHRFPGKGELRLFEGIKDS